MSLNIATELVAHVAAFLSGREAAGPGGGPQSGRGKKSDLRLDYISGDVRFHKARNSDEATSPFDSGILDAIYEVGDLLEERGGGMGLMIGRPADPPRF